MIIGSICCRTPPRWLFVLIATLSYSRTNWSHFEGLGHPAHTGPHSHRSTTRSPISKYFYFNIELNVPRIGPHLHFIFFNKRAYNKRSQSTIMLSWSKFTCSHPVQLQSRNKQMLKNYPFNQVLIQVRKLIFFIT